MGLFRQSRFRNKNRYCLTIRSYVRMNHVVQMKTATQHDAGTVNRLLDAAERLFAEHGYDGVGMRQLADEAQVNLGAATYHFGSKEKLFIETFMRRFRPAHSERLRLLQEAEAVAGSKPLPIEKIVECMIRPLFELGLEHPVFHLLLGQNLFNPPAFLQSAVHKELGPNIEQFIKAFRRALPKMPEDLIHLRTMWAMGGLLLFSVRAGELPGMHNKKVHEALLQEMVRFMSAGMQSAPVLDRSKRPALFVPPKPPRR